MKKRLLYTTRPLFGLEGQGISSHMGILQKDHHEVDLLHSLRTDQAVGFLEDYAGLRINKHFNLYSEFYENEAKEFSDWECVYRALDVGPLERYDELFLIGGLLNWRSGFTRRLEENPRSHWVRNQSFPQDRASLRWESWGRRLINILALLKAHREFGIPLHEMAFDPQEMSMDLVQSTYAPRDNYHLYHGYDIPRYGIKRLDSLQYHLENHRANQLSLSLGKPKHLDLMFGYTVMKNSLRMAYLPFIDRMKEQANRALVVCRNDMTGEDTHMPRDIYLEHIASSRFTLILPAYVSSCFSVYRLIESLEHDCLPIIHEDCHTEEVGKSFGVDLSPLVRDTYPKERTRVELLDYYRSKILVMDKDFQISGSHDEYRA